MKVHQAIPAQNEIRFGKVAEPDVKAPELQMIPCVTRLDLVNQFFDDVRTKIVNSLHRNGLHPVKITTGYVQNTGDPQEFEQGRELTNKLRRVSQV